MTNMNATLSEDVFEERHTSMEEVLPLHILSDICNRVRDAKDLANCAATSRTMGDAVRNVQSLNLICLKKYFLLARKRFPIRLPCPTSDDEDDLDTDSEDDSDEEEVEPCVASAPTSSSSEQQPQDDVSENSAPISGSSAQQPQDALSGKPTLIPGSSLPQDGLCGKPASAKPPVYVSFKIACLNMLGRVKDVKHLRIEVDQEMQANLFQKEEIHMVDFWLSEPMFVRKWVSACFRTLQHLTVVDYGQQAIMRQSPILRVLSENCKELTHLELRNMYLDTNDLDKLPKLESLTLRCIKMTERSLTDINMCMPALITLALVSVFGVQEARMVSRKLEVLCLGLSTSARIVDLNLPEVKKLQLKMTCPDILRVRAPKLTYVAVCMEKRDRPEVEFMEVNKLKELLFGASHFSLLPYLMKSNHLLEKIFLDLPCMALGEDGKWEGVLEQIPRSLPDIEVLKASCPILHTLSVGPGLWHSMEESFEINQELATFRRWRTLTRFIVHMVVQSVDNCMSVLQWLVDAVPTLKFLEIYVHVDSPADRQLFRAKCEEEFTMLTKLTMGTWKRSLNFTCFSF